MREDVVLDLPGSSPFAGEHHGHESVGKFLLGIRQFVISKDPLFTFVHDATSMTASHEISVAGPNHIVEMTFFSPSRSTGKRGSRPSTSSRATPGCSRT